MSSSSPIVLWSYLGFGASLVVASTAFAGGNPAAPLVALRCLVRLLLRSGGFVLSRKLRRGWNRCSARFTAIAAASVFLVAVLVSTRVRVVLRGKLLLVASDSGIVFVSDVALLVVVVAAIPARARGSLRLGWGRRRRLPRLVTRRWCVLWKERIWVRRLVSWSWSRAAASCRSWSPWVREAVALPTVAHWSGARYVGEVLGCFRHVTRRHALLLCLLLLLKKFLFFLFSLFNAVHHAVAEIHQQAWNKKVVLWFWVNFVCSILYSQGKRAKQKRIFSSPMQIQIPRRAHVSPGSFSIR